MEETVSKVSIFSVRVWLAQGHILPEKQDKPIALKAVVFQKGK